ncbi:MAG TPA: hypothetical protein VHW65_13370 [Gemmatimonadales bacterium]|jgi:hypothetical protein|nr:hypothetical protein [Gemmatimonadales bacterium]
MAIDPLNSPGMPRPGLSRADETLRGEAISADTTPAKPRTEVAAADQLDLSPAAAALTGTDAVPSGTLDPERLKAIAQRVASGAYDTPEVQDRIAGQLLSSPDALGS